MFQGFRSFFRDTLAANIPLRVGHDDGDDQEDDDEENDDDKV